LSTPIFEVGHAHILDEVRPVEEALGRRGRAVAWARAARRRSAVTRRSDVTPASGAAVWAQNDASRDDPCAVLREVAAAREAAAAAVRAEVKRLGSADVDWPAIGRALGVTRQAVRHRYGLLSKKDDTGQ
jgi:hypothetical protein